MKRETLSDRELAELIAPAFERLPEPDARRLAAIEQRLLEQPRPRRRTKIAWWWLAGALVASAASALWWAVDYDSDQGLEETAPVLTSPSSVPTGTDQSARPSGPTGTESAPAGQPTKKSGPMIYQRE